MTPFPKREDYQTPEYEIRQMWANGPTRRWNAKSRSSLTPLPYETGGFVGMYVCQGCNQQTPGVYRQTHGENAGKWLCGPCANPPEAA